MKKHKAPLDLDSSPPVCTYPPKADALPMGGTSYLHKDCQDGLSEAVHKTRAYHVVEIGSLCGASALHMATVAYWKPTIYCVDPWVSYDQLASHQQDFDRVYRQFLSNVVQAGLEEQIVPVRKPSPEAAVHFEDESVQLIYIDGYHSRAAVRSDILAWWPKLQRGGIMCGDDILWPGVRSGIEDACSFLGRDVKIETHEEHFWRLTEK